MVSEHAPSLSDVFLMLGMVKSYSENGPASRKYVISTFNDSPVKQAKIPSYAAIEELCSKLGLLSISGNKIILTQLGEQMLKHSDNWQKYEFGNFFVKNVVLGSEMGKAIRSSLSKFRVGKYGIWCHPKDDVYELVDLPEIIPILYEIGLLEKREGMVEISPRHMHLIHDRRKKITQKQLDSQLQIQKTVGEIGEEIVLDFERERLNREGHQTEAAKVARISSEFVNAGYDIDSFVRNKDGRIHRAYIEVKGSIGTYIDFHWSVNEIEKAREYGVDYWIYFVPGIDIRSRQSSVDPVRIQDPYREIFEGSGFKTEPEQYHVTKDGAC